MPAEGKTYVFMAKKKDDGFLIAGENTNIEITDREMIDQLDINTLNECLSE